MQNLGSIVGTGVASSAAAMSFVWAFYVPYGRPWPSVGWALMACAAAVWVVSISMRSSPSMGDVIGEVEAETPLAAVPQPQEAP